MHDLLDAARRVVESTYEEQSGQPDLRTPPDKTAVDDLEAALSEYEWSDEPPTEPGWYWVDDGQESTFCPRCVDVRKYHASGKELGVWDPDVPTGMTKRVSDYKDCQWAGPIPEPTDTDR